MFTALEKYIDVRCQKPTIITADRNSLTERQMSYFVTLVLLDNKENHNFKHKEIFTNPVVGGATVIVLT